MAVAAVGAAVAPRALGWAALVLAGSVWSGVCEHAEYDYRASTAAGCVVTKSSGGNCSDASAVPRGCLAPAAIYSLSPRWFGQMMAVPGPVWTWLPLGLWLAAVLVLQRRARVGSGRGVWVDATTASAAVVMRTALLLAAAWYLALIPLLRNLASWFAAVGLPPFDPSGHIFVIGVQLVPLWLWYAARHCAGPLSTEAAGGEEPVALGTSHAWLPLPPHHPDARERRRHVCSAQTLFAAGLLLAEGLLWYTSFATAAWFHTPAATTVALLAPLTLTVAAAYLTVRASRARATNAGLSPSQVRTAAAVVGGAWAAGTLGAVIYIAALAPRGGVASLAGAIGYDTVVAAAAFLLLRTPVLLPAPVASARAVAVSDTI